MQPQDFHLRAEVKVSARGDSGVFFRAQVPNFGTRSYEANIGTPAAGGEALNRWSGQRQTWKAAKPQPVEEWFTLEIIAQGAHLRVLQNGETIVDVTDPKPFVEEGHIGLQHFHADTGVWFRKVEIKDISPTPRRYQNALGMEFALVPKGKGWLGGDGGKPGDKEVEFKEDFYLGVYEVTQEEWEKVMGTNPSQFSRKGSVKNAVKDVSDQDLKRFPVDHVSRNAAQDFLARLNLQEKGTGWIYRLPTRDEWEYACRGGPMRDRFDGAFDFYLQKPTNELRPDQACIAPPDKKPLERPCKVGSYPPNVLGLFDMHGNMCEWCHDEGARPKDADPKLKVYWVIAGSFIHPAEAARAGKTAGFGYSEKSNYMQFGFRVARVRVAAPDRQVAEWWLSIGGAVDITTTDSKLFHVNNLKNLPQGPFQVHNLGTLRAGSKLTDSDLDRLADLGKLNGLALNVPGITDEGLKRLANLRGLSLLQLDADKTTAAGLAHLKLVPELVAVILWNGSLTDEGFRELLQIPHLRNLQLNKVAITDGGLKYAREAPKLQSFVLNGAPITDAGLVHLKELKTDGLDLRDNKGIKDPGLEHLTQMKQVRMIRLQGTTVTAAGVKKLAAALPHCKIEWDGGVIEPRMAPMPCCGLRRGAERATWSAVA
jgi:formylglycine-generating enzyme required for sulfatase activity